MRGERGRGRAVRACAVAGVLGLVGLAGAGCKGPVDPVWQPGPSLEQACLELAEEFDSGLPRAGWTRVVREDGAIGAVPQECVELVKRHGWVPGE